jgi:predicted RNA-binding protein with PUA domain
MIPYTDGDEEVVQVMEFDERNLSWRDGLTLTEVGEIIEKQFRDWTIISIEECV